MKKRIMAMLLAAVLCMSLMACGSKVEPPAESAQPAEAPAAQPVEEAPAKELPAEEAEPAEDSALPLEEPAEEAAEAETSEAPEADTTEEPKTDLKLGQVSGNSYYNETFKLACELDEDWTVATREQVDEIFGYTYSVLSDNDLSDLLSQGNSVADFYAENIYGDTLNIQISKLGALSTVQAMLVSDETLVQETLAYMESYADSLYAALNLSQGKLEAGTVEFLGEEMPCICLSAVMETESGDYDFYETIVLYQSFNYLATITAGAYEIDTTADALACFSSK
ncbi:MAG: hypothetical protein MJ075_04805 [Oscillospiraceae bacterium]|nr:hypothetical protein [Oscillospiraceae bacterium]